MARSSWSSVAGRGCLPPLAPWLKEGLSAFGPPRDRFGLLFRLLDCGQQGAGQRLEGEGIGTDQLDQFAELRRLLEFDLLGTLGERLEFGIKVTRLPGHPYFPRVVRPER